MRRRGWWIAAAAAVAVWLATGAGIAAWLYPLREHQGQLAQATAAPYSGDGLTLSLDDFQLLTELPPSPGKKPSVAPAGSKFAVVRLRQTVTDTGTLGSCQLAFVRGEQRWTVQADFMNPLGDANSPLLPKSTMCQGRYSSPTPQVGDSFVIGIAVIVPDSVADDGLRPIATVTSADAASVHEVRF